jgi:hypothetical protein
MSFFQSGAVSIPVASAEQTMQRAIDLGLLHGRAQQPQRSPAVPRTHGAPPAATSVTTLGWVNASVRHQRRQARAAQARPLIAPNDGVRVAQLQAARRSLVFRDDACRARALARLKNCDASREYAFRTGATNSVTYYGGGAR